MSRSIVHSPLAWRTRAGAPMRASGASCTFPSKSTAKTTAAKTV